MPPTAINTGEQVELLLGRIAAPYFEIQDFDDLPTPFRTVAVDLLSAQPVIMRSGSLADAMRATMSLPLIFPPTQVNGQVLIDGGTMDNVPADVVKAMDGCRVVSHQAAQLEITKCLEDPIDDLVANTHATLNVFEAAAKVGVERVIYASSACVYGQPEYIPSDEAKHPTNPNWPYGVSKLACEKYAATYCERTGIPTRTPSLVPAERIAKRRGLLNDEPTIRPVASASRVRSRN